MRPQAGGNELGSNAKAKQRQARTDPDQKTSVSVEAAEHVRKHVQVEAARIRVNQCVCAMHGWSRRGRA